LVFSTIKPSNLSRKFYSNSSSSSSSSTSSSSSNSSSTSSQYKIRIPNFKISLQQTEEEAISEIGKFIEIRDSVVMHSLDERGFEYAILSQLNREKWGGKKLEEKDDVIHYHNNLELQAYAKDMIDKVAHHNRGIQIRQHNAYIGERGLYNVSKDYKKIIIIFDTRSPSR
jgi:hypothetical protein